MSFVSATLRRAVTLRAGNRCEYCGISQEGQEATFHIDHVHPTVLGGETVEENLALACVSCSLRKAARVQATDPLSRENAVLFNPRKDSWRTHFRWEGPVLRGLSPTGRATVEALFINRPLAVAIRRQEVETGRHPPPGHL